mgnify:CR=1
MIHVHTYKVKINGEDDYCQFYEYSPRKGIKVIDSQDIPIALLFPRHLIPRQYLRNLVKHYYGDDCHVVFVSSVQFDDSAFDLG